MTNTSSDMTLDVVGLLETDLHVCPAHLSQSIAYVDIAILTSELPMETVTLLVY